MPIPKLSNVYHSEPMVKSTFDQRLAEQVTATGRTILFQLVQQYNAQLYDATGHITYDAPLGMVIDTTA